MILSINKKLKTYVLGVSWKDTTGLNNLNCWNSACHFSKRDQSNKFKAVAKSCVWKDSGCTSCSRLRAAGKHWYCPQHQVSQLTSSGNGLKTENSTFSMWQLVKTSLNCSGSSCVDQVHVCPVCAELPPEMPTLGLAATYLVDVFPPLARSTSTWKLWMKMYICSSVDSMWQCFPWLKLCCWGVTSAENPNFYDICPNLAHGTAGPLPLWLSSQQSAWCLTLKHHIFSIF